MRAGRLALGVGVIVALVTAASRAGLLGPHDFTVIALLGLIGAALCAPAVTAARSPASVAGLLLSLLPVALLVFFLTTSDG